MTTKDFTTGLVTAVVALASTLSYSALIFSGPLASALPLGIGYGLVSAGLSALVFALVSSIPFAIAGPDSKPVAVLSALAGSVGATLTAHGKAAVLGPTVFIGLVVGTLLTGIVLVLFGLLKTGRWIRFVPYPVIGGFLGASGWLLASGGVRVLTGLPLTWETLAEIGAPAHLHQLAAGAAFVVCFVLIRRVKHAAAFPALLIAGTLVTHLGLQAAGLSIDEARRSGWLLDIASGATLPNPWFSGMIGHVDWLVLLQTAGEYVALAAITASTLLLSTTAVEVAARLDVDVDRELVVNGASNLLVGLCGGMVGTLSVSRTVFNFASGARSRNSGIVTGLACLGVLGFGTGALGYIPIPLLGGLLLQLGGSMLDEWLVKGYARMQRADYLQVLIIFIVIARWDFVAGVAVGVVAACVTFAINSSRIRLVKLGLSRSQYASRVDRPPNQHQELLRHGSAIQLLWLHGFIFFGSATRLLAEIKQIVAGAENCRMVVLDFHQVLGIDSSAVLSFLKLRQFAEREDLIIVLSALPPKVEHSLHQGGFLSAVDDPVCRRFAEIDAALEWCEDRLLSERMSREDVLRSADEWLAREIGSQTLFTRLVSYLEMIEYQPGETLCAQGEAADSLFLLYAGRVTVIFEGPDGAALRLRSMVRHTVVGEMGLYRNQPRGASIRVELPTIVYRLSADAIDQMEQDDPPLAYAFHKFVIRTLAARLDFANHMVASLQR